jgi:hypothetical protein
MCNRSRIFETLGDILIALLDAQYKRLATSDAREREERRPTDGHSHLSRSGGQYTTGGGATRRIRI